MGRSRNSRSNRFLKVESLERRDVPATWGVAWPDAQHLTLSFVPDGTSVEGQSSQLFQKLDSQLGAGNWETAILDAYQTWAVNSNINVGLVSDDGEALGTVGPAQGDPRFGDIRVSAVPLPAGVAAITSPFDPSTGTISGDLILNSNQDFSSTSGFDLYTVALHEAGHSFGFADSNDPSSFMYDVYQGKQTGLAPGAVPALQALYGGPRDSTITAGKTVSEDSSHPTDITNQIVAGVQTSNYGDIDSATSANYYQFRAPLISVAPNGIDIQVKTAGISQLVPRITVTDIFGNVVKGATATSSLDGGVTVHLALFVPLATYNIKVDGPSHDIHSIGSYELSVSPTITLLSLIPSYVGAKPISGTGIIGDTPLTTNTTIGSTNQIDNYRFSLPLSLSLKTVSVQLQVYGIGLNLPQIAIYNSLGILVAKATATDPNQSTLTLQLNNVLPLSGYVVQVTNGTVNSAQFGAYQLAVSTGTAAASLPTPILQTPWLGSKNSSLSKPNTTFKQAAQLQTPDGHKSGTYYAAISGISSSQPAQFYQVSTPASMQSGYMTIAVQGLGNSNLNPWLSVFDANGNRVATQVLTQADGVGVIQVPFSGSSKFVIEVSASGSNGGNTTGNYYLNATFGVVGASLKSLSSGSIYPMSAASASLTTPSSSIYQFTLVGDPGNAGSDTTLRLTVKDASGNVVATLTSLASEAASTTAVLGAGTYFIYVDTYSPTGASVPTVSYKLFGTNLTDPIKTFSSTGSGTSQTKV